MKFNPEKLVKALEATDLPHNSIPFIHGALTLSAVSMEMLELEQRCALIFALDEQHFESGRIPYKKILSLIELTEDIEDAIIEDIEGCSFAPCLQSDLLSLPETEALCEWCKGFMAALFFQKDLWFTGDEPLPELQGYIGVIAYKADPDMFNLSAKDRKVMEEIVSDPLHIIGLSVLELYGYWGERETEFEDDYDAFDDGLEDYNNEPLVHEEKKPGRNDPCPCGSGKKYKKCCENKDCIEKTLDPENKIIEFTGIAKPASASAKNKKRCFICGKTKNLTKTSCCDHWICDDEDQYVLFSYARNSCHRNHSRFSLCGQHFAQNHPGDWKTCAKCREGCETEMYVWYGTNEYNAEMLPNPPSFKPTLCAKCKRRIVLSIGGYSISKGKYYCSRCASPV